MQQEPIRWLPPTGPEAQPAFEPAPPPEKPRRGLWRLIYPVVAAIVLLGGKLKAILLLLPKLKVLTTGASMILSVGAYALIWGWKFAVGFVALLFLHELGHYIQMRREGVQPGMMVFIPFLGAAVTAKSLGGNALAEARVGLAGPILGTLACAIPAVLWQVTGEEFFQALTFTGCLLNLFNLLPVVPLDGGRAMAAMAPWMWFVGFGVVVLLAFVWPNPILVLIAILAGFELYRRWRDRKQGEEGNPSYYKVATRHRLMVAAVYIGLILVLAIGMDLTFLDRSSRI